MKVDATVTSKGQITLPVALRDELRIKTGDRIRFERSGRRVVIRAIHRTDLMSLAGVLARAAGRSAGADFPALRRETWRRRGKQLDRRSRA